MVNYKGIYSIFYYFLLAEFVEFLMNFYWPLQRNLFNFYFIIIGHLQRNVFNFKLIFIVNIYFFIFLPIPVSPRALTLCSPAFIRC
jgi:hypothetical protein